MSTLRTQTSDAAAERQTRGSDATGSPGRPARGPAATFSAPRVKDVRLGGLTLLAAILIALGVVLPSSAQDSSPRLASLLDKLPADLPTDAPGIRAELLKLDAADIRALCGMLVEPGTGDDTKARYALHGLALAVTDPGCEAQRETFVRAVTQALHASPPPQDEGFLLRHLRLVASQRSVDALSHALLSDRSCDDAATALITIGGQAAEDALRNALSQAHGRCRIAIIDALGVLADAQSVPTLLEDAAGEDRDLRLAALYALARSGDPAAADTLTGATRAHSRYERSRATDFLLTYAARLAEKRHPEQAAAILRDLLETRTSPGDTHVRCAALDGLATALGNAAAGDVLAALNDENPQVRAAAANAAVMLPGQEATEACIRAFEQATPGGRAVILDVLTRRGDKRALPMAIASLDDDSEEVRLAAIATVAALGRADAVQVLVGALATSQPAERKAAHEALIRIPERRATKLIDDAIGGVTPPVRILLLDILASRPPTGELDAVFAATRDADPRVRSAALRALGVLGNEEALSALLMLLVKAETDGERLAAEQALAAICRRCDDRERPVSLMINVLSRHDANTRCSMLRVLGQVGGRRALQAVRTDVDDAREEVREAAIRAFQTWPDGDAAEVVLGIVRDAEKLKHHVLAMRAFARLADLGDRSAEAKVAMYEAGIKAARRTEEKKLLVSKLGEVGHLQALELLYNIMSNDDELLAEAASAMLGGAEKLLPGGWAAAADAADAVLEFDVPDSIRERAEKLLTRAAEYEGFITDWWVAGPYTQPGKSGHELFAVAFPPEQRPTKGMAWRCQPAHRDPDRGCAIDLHATMRGDNRAGYLFTRVYSPGVQEVRLELGSDDGIKVWLNGRVVHANNALRVLSPATDKLDVSLNQGWNELMLKVTNDGGAWAACARLRAPDGGKLDGVYAEAGEKP